MKPALDLPSVFRPAMPRRGILRMGSVLVALALLAGACGDSDDDKAADKTSAKSAVDPASCPVEALAKATKPIDITFWHSMADANESTLKAMIADYNASQSKVRVNLQFQGDYDDTAKKYVATLQQGDLPELVQLHEIYPRMMIDTKSTMPVQACIDAENYDLSDYLAAPLKQFNVDGIQWSMPFNTSVPVLYYNRAAFKKAGLDPDLPPTTFEEMRSASEKIVSSGAARSGIAFELKADPIAEWMSLAGQPLVDRGNGRNGQATKAAFDTKTGLEVYRFMKTMMDDKLAISVGRNRAGVDHLLALAKGDAAMAIFTSSSRVSSRVWPPCPACATPRAKAACSWEEARCTSSRRAQPPSNEQPHGIWFVGWTSLHNRPDCTRRRGTSPSVSQRPSSRRSSTCGRRIHCSGSATTS
ncbi:MAG: extracellular solute-binding protein [Actinobacteria bacterium]|nr:extracellular solute-binding protein [Actinomycetota bacterium]